MPLMGEKKATTNPTDRHIRIPAPPFKHTPNPNPSLTIKPIHAHLAVFDIVECLPLPVVCLARLRSRAESWMTGRG